jgi:hypothetical protein
MNFIPDYTGLFKKLKFELDFIIVPPAMEQSSQFITPVPIEG